MHCLTTWHIVHPTVAYTALPFHRAGRSLPHQSCAVTAAAVAR